MEKMFLSDNQFSDYYDFREYLEGIINGDIVKYNIDELKERVYEMYCDNLISPSECDHLNRLIEDI